jgi:hypothetical protein
MSGAEAGVSVAGISDTQRRRQMMTAVPWPPGSTVVSVHPIPPARKKSWSTLKVRRSLSLGLDGQATTVRQRGTVLSVRRPHQVRRGGGVHSILTTPGNTAGDPCTFAFRLRFALFSQGLPATIFHHGVLARRTSSPDVARSVGTRGGACHDHRGLEFVLLLLLLLLLLLPPRLLLAADVVDPRPSGSMAGSWNTNTNTIVVSVSVSVALAAALVAAAMILGFLRGAASKSARLVLPSSCTGCKLRANKWDFVARAERATAAPAIAAPAIAIAAVVVVASDPPMCLRSVGRSIG